MNRLEKTLLKTRMTYEQACVQLGVRPDDDDVPPISNIDQCNHCDIWYKYKDLANDEDDNLICRICYNTYGP